ncbi:MAG: beta-ketoacyl-[acyl-carrier-protein] synthase family protein [Planctomycetaceae bacterium]
MSLPVSGVSVVITGIGMVTPLGTTRESTWSALLAGERAGTDLNLAGMGPAWKGIAPDPLWRGCPVRRTWDYPGEPIIGDALVAAREAVSHAGLEHGDPWRWGCVLGASKGGMHLATPMFVSQYLRGSDSAVAPWSGLADDAWRQIWPDAPSSAIASEFDIRGPVLAPAAACATGLVSLIRAADLIRDGVCDVVLCGSSDASLQPSLLGSYRRLGVLARQGDPRTACKPFDQDRDGFLVGEGAAVMVLESRSHAERRRAVPLAEFVAGRTFSDGSGVAGLDESADGLSRAIAGVTSAGGLSAADVDLVNFHGTGTEQNDRTEVSAMTKALSGRPMQGVGCAFKGALGHLMGAAGSVEVALAVLALRDQVAPPTANLQCVADDLKSLGSLRFTGHTSTPMAVNTVLKTSLGFGGPVAAALLRRVGNSR